MMAATLAHLAAFNNLKVVLIERGDYAADPWSILPWWSVHLYEEQEGLSPFGLLTELDAALDLLYIAPHLVSPYAVKHDRLQERVHFLLSGNCLPLLAAFYRLTGNRLAAPYLAKGCALGIRSPRRLTLERILAARQEGALCLNYVQAEKVVPTQDGRLRVYMRPVCPGDETPAWDVSAGLLVDCQIGGFQKRIDPTRIVVMLFGQENRGEIEFFGGSDRYGRFRAMLGDFEQGRAAVMELPAEVSQNAEQGLNLSLERIEAVKPAFSHEVGSLRWFEIVDPPQKDWGPLWKTSRRNFKSRCRSPVHAARDAFWALRRMLRSEGVSHPLVSLRGRLLPGAADMESLRNELKLWAGGNKVQETVANAAMRRFGARTRRWLAEPHAAEIVGQTHLRGELEEGAQSEQGCNVRDVLLGRLEAQWCNEYGQGLFPELEAMMQNCGEECKVYSDSIAEMRAVIQRALRGDSGELS